MSIDIQVLWSTNYRPLVLGGKLCLDFANSVEPRGGPPPYAVPQGYNIRDCFHNYGDIIAWGVYTNALTEGEAEICLRQAQKEQDKAAAVFHRALVLRDAVYRIFWAIAKQDVPKPEDMRLLVDEHHSAAVHTQLMANGSTFQWWWMPQAITVDYVLWPVVRSAADLLVHGELERVKVCPGTPGSPVPCAWLFYDSSKNRTRHWCSMLDCGGKVKTRRQNERRRINRQQSG